MITLIVVNLKARLQPMHRHNLEDGFEEFCQENNIPLEIVGGGTQISDNGEPLECDIEIGGTENHQLTSDDVTIVRDFFSSTFAPNGSKLQILHEGQEKAETIDIGNLEGLSLIMNGTELPDEVYEQNDINHVVEKCEELMAGIGEFHSYCETQDTMLYFYGESFEKMKQAILPFTADYPLCQKSKIEQIA